MLKRMKLTAKLAVVIGIFLAGVFTVLILVTGLLSARAIRRSITGELTAIAKANGTQVQQIFDTAGSVAGDMQSYLLNFYKLAAESPEEMVVPTDPMLMELCESAIYDKILTSLTYDVENYLSETARNTVLNHEDIMGVGVMFEPYHFQADMKDFAFYVDKEHAEDKIEPFGSYETYSAEEYYQSARDSKAAMVTKPYAYNGTAMVSYSAPIVTQGEVQGVVMADINIGNFNRIDSHSESYPSLYAKVYDNDGTVIYDSQNPDNVGKNMEEFSTDADELAKMRSGMAQGEAFQVDATRSDGKRMTMFFSPVQAGSQVWWSLTGLTAGDIGRSCRPCC